MFSPSQTLASPAHREHHLVTLVVSGNGGVDRCDVNARGFQGVVSSLIDG